MIPYAPYEYENAYHLREIGPNDMTPINMMRTCIYDNEILQRREFWSYGKMIEFIDSRAIYERKLEKFVPNQIIGRKDAMCG